MSDYPDILIVGGGIIGLTTAYFLAREGVVVEVVDRGDFGREASWAGAGILPPGNAALAATPYDLLRAHSAALFPALTADLRERTGCDNGYFRCGGLEIDRVDQEASEVAWRNEGISFDTLTTEACRRLIPGLPDSVAKAHYFPEMAQLRNPRHLKALMAGCRSFGVRFRAGCPAHRFEKDGTKVRAIHTSAGRLCAGKYLLATGAWTDSLLEDLGCRPGIRPVRGQIALLNTVTPLFQPILLDGDRYLVPRRDGRLLVGATEEDAGFEKRTTAAAIASLLVFAQEMVPALAEAHLEHTWAGLRPGSPDGLPFLGPVPGCDNLLVAAGHYRAGIQLSPATGQVMKEWLLGQTLTVPIESFRLDRPPSPRQRSAFRS